MKNQFSIFVLGLLLLPICGRGEGRIVINEVQSSNGGTLVDASGATPDWIELRNVGDEMVDLGGWGLSDKPAKPFKWTFPAGTSIAAGEYLVVFADGGDETAGGELHANFSLSSGGEELVLTRPGGEAPEDGLVFGRMPMDASAGRSADGELVYFAVPTPGAANAAETFSEPCAEVEFSVARGLFEEGFALTLDYGAEREKQLSEGEIEIRYTLDHSRPSATNGEVYAGKPIGIDRTTTVRAVAVRKGALPLPDCATHTYIFPEQVAGQRPSTSVPSIWTDLGRDNVVKSTKASYTLSASVLKTADDRSAFAAALRALPIMAVTLGDDELFDAQDGLYSKPVTLEGVERQAGIEWLNANDEFGVDAGFEVHGASSRYFNTTPKKSFRLSFRGRYGTSSLDHKVLADGGCSRKGFKKLVLRGENNGSWHWGGGNVNGTSFKDQLFRDLQQELSGYSLGGTFVHLFLNGLYWGIYNVTEHASADYAAQTFGGKAQDWTRAKFNYIAEGDGYGYFTMMSHALREPKSMAKASEYGQMASRLDIAAFIDYMILEYWSANTDWPGNNVVCLGAVAHGHRYRFMIWDLEFALEDMNANRMTLETTYYGPQLLQQALRYSTPYCRQFALRTEQLFGEGGALSKSAFSNRVDRLAGRLRPAIFAESARWGAYCHECRSSSYPIYTTNHWEKAVARLQTTVPDARTPIFMAQLSELRLHPGTMPAEDELLVTPTLVPEPIPFAVNWNVPEGAYPKDGIPRVAGFQCLEEQLTVKLANLTPGGRYSLKISESLSQLSEAEGIEVLADGESQEVQVVLPQRAETLFMRVLPR